MCMGKIVFSFSLHKGRQTSNELKRNMNDGTVIFLTCLLIVLIKHHCFWKNAFTILFEIMKTIQTQAVLTLYISSHQMYSVRKGVLKNIAKFTGIHLCQRLFFYKVAGLRQFDWIKYIFKIWFNQSEKSSVVDVWLCSKYPFVNITFHLTFFRSFKKVYSS